MISKIAGAAVDDVLLITRFMAQSMRDKWPGINQPYQPKEDDGDED